MQSDFNIYITVLTVHSVLVYGQRDAIMTQQTVAYCLHCVYCVIVVTTLLGHYYDYQNREGMYLGDSAKLC